MQSEGARRRVQALIDLAWQSMPRTEAGSGEFTDWKTYARASVARCAYLCESVLALGDRALDGEVVARSLFEHVITFAWVAVDPAQHLPRWIAKDIRDRQTLMQEASSRFGFEGLPEDVKQAFYEMRDGVTERPGVADMAREADKHWVEVCGGIFRERSSLAALYTVGFRGYSAAVHPTAQALMPFLSHNWKAEVVVSRPVFDPRRCPFGECSSAMTALLIVTSQTLGWPDTKRIHEIWRADPAKND